MNSLQGELKELKGAQRDRLFREWISLKKELRTRETKAVEDVLSGCDVVLATCSGAADRSKIILETNTLTSFRYLKTEKSSQFDLVVIDEAGQALEAACWVPLLKGRKAVLAGICFIALFNLILAQEIIYSSHQRYTLRKQQKLVYSLLCLRESSKPLETSMNDSSLLYFYESFSYHVHRSRVLDDS